MKRLIYIIIFVPFLCFSQGWNQVGIDIDGEAVEDRIGHASP